MKLKNCTNCKQQFPIYPEDQSYYNRIQVPEPTWCPPCREMRRMAWCNEGTLYNRNCDLTGKPIISEYSPENPRLVYSVQAWWSDGWDPLMYGRDFDFNRPFFEQFHELELSVPHQGVQMDSGSVNSDYTHYAGRNKNCYFIFHADFNEDCYYGYGIKKAKDCIDNHYCHESELCYECTDVQKCHDLKWSQDCTNCASSALLRDCVSCMDCFMCVGLRNKKFCFLNQQLTEEQYREKMRGINTGSWKSLQMYLMQFHELESKHSYRYLHNNMIENSLGDYLYRAKNCYHCFDASDLEDCRYVSQVQLGVKDSYDIYQFGMNMELCYESAMTGMNVTEVFFTNGADGQVSNIQYCIHCFSSNNLFGCVGVKRNKFCILNKQYSEEKYYLLKAKIIEHMKKTGEYGEFFPIKYSPFGFNESTAQFWYPVTKEQALEKGWRWEDKLSGTYGKETVMEIPDDIKDVPDSFSKEVLACLKCKKNYQITQQELSSYKKLHIPIPRECFNCRRSRRRDMRNPRKFWYRKCMNQGCENEFYTTYAPSKPQTIYCESCYLAITY